jgi:hypothetical protein
MLAYEEALERFVPVLMAQAKIYWDTEHYAMVEKIFKQSVEFCSEVRWGRGARSRRAVPTDADPRAVSACSTKFGS